MDTTRSALLNPLLTDTQMNSPGTSANVHFFFTKNKGEESVCKHCRSKNGWQIFLEYVKNAFTNGYTFTILHEILHWPGVIIQSLPPVSMINSNHSQSLFPSAPLTSLEAGLPLFSQAIVHQYLIRFILSDNQVHFYLLMFRFNNH
ncbi:hypothetical protein V8B97DRAFT_2026213 [Scleroderma yunnanense]